MEAKTEQGGGIWDPFSKETVKLGHNSIINIQKALVMEGIKSASPWKVMFYKALGSDWENPCRYLQPQETQRENQCVV